VIEAPAAPTRERLAARRRALTQRSNALRASALAHAAGLQPALDWADRVRDTWHWLLRRPPELVLPVAVVAVVWVVRKPSRLWRLSWRAWSAWRLWQRVASRLV
jgi:hypothetical protein